MTSPWIIPLTLFCQIVLISSAVIDQSNCSKKEAVNNGYQHTPGVGTYKYHNLKAKSWNDARDTCLNEGAHLAVINSAEEEAVLVNFMKTSVPSVDQLWLGVHELFKKDDCVSVKDERLDAIGYVHWKSGQPDSTSDEHCLTVTESGMNDFVCDRELFFVCKK